MKKIVQYILLISITFFSVEINAQQIPLYVGTGAAALPPPPTANLVAHYDASDASSITITTGVSKWNDLSGNGNNLLQNVGSKQPTYTGTGTSSIVNFDGSNDDLKTANFTLNQPETIYVVVKQVTWTINRYLTDGSTTDRMDIYDETSTPSIALYAGSSTSVNSGLTLNTVMVVAAVFNGASSSVSVNDNTKATGNVGSNNAGGFTLGSAGSEAGAFSNIGVQEVYIYSAAHSNAQQTAIISYLRAKWGI